MLTEPQMQHGGSRPTGHVEDRHNTAERLLHESKFTARIGRNIHDGTVFGIHDQFGNASTCCIHDRRAGPICCEQPPLGVKNYICDLRKVRHDMESAAGYGAKGNFSGVEIQRRQHCVFAIAAKHIRHQGNVHYPLDMAIEHINDTHQTAFPISNGDRPATLERRDVIRRVRKSNTTNHLIDRAVDDCNLRTGLRGRKKIIDGIVRPCRSQADPDE
jgi:hypothetical protein